MSIKSILSFTNHRQYPVPQRPWQHYQEWHGNLMLHWEADADKLIQLIPDGLTLDVFEGKAYVSLIAFTVENMRPRFFFPIPYLSDFHEVNLRTYVIRNGKPGIYFLKIDAGKLLPAMLARNILGLPYRKATMKRKGRRYVVKGKDTSLSLRYFIGPKLQEYAGLDYWLTERHCLYENRAGGLIRIDIHHKPWKLQKAEIQFEAISYTFCDGQPVKMHYCRKQKVVVWNRVVLGK